jgi:hypothetical protein
MVRMTITSEPWQHDFRGGGRHETCHQQRPIADPPARAACASFGALLVDVVGARERIPSGQPSGHRAPCGTRGIIGPSAESAANSRRVEVPLVKQTPIRLLVRFQRGGMCGFIYPHQPATGQRDTSDRSPPFAAHIRAGNASFGHLRDEPLHVIAHQK